MDFTIAFQTISSIAALNVLVAGWVITHVMKSTSVMVLNSISLNQIVSWVTGIALCFFGAWLNVGILASATAAWTILVGLGVGIVSNGIFSIDLVQQFLTLIRAKK